MYLKKPEIAVVISINPHIFGDILFFTLTKEKRIYGGQFRKSLDSNFLRQTSLMGNG